ncbi:holin family protein [uncultured Megasphaera sp.]|uniref:phage holin family protein n=1 Tax=uncultured Megasphaera sp. TaxID=165188 RepID=UPI00266B580D|nr:phage holin family protein [uncultured Megasphaera sp.]
MMNMVINFFREMVPAESEIEWGAAVSCVGSICSYFLGWSALIEALIVAMAIDYITGILAAYINPNMQLNSQRGFRGICKKLVILLLVALAHKLDQVTGQPAIQALVVWFFLGNEGLSIIENAAKAGLPIPDKLRDTLEQITTSK